MKTITTGILALLLSVQALAQSFSVGVFVDTNGVLLYPTNLFQANSNRLNGAVSAISVNSNAVNQPNFISTGDLQWVQFGSSFYGAIKDSVVSSNKLDATLYAWLQDLRRVLVDSILVSGLAGGDEIEFYFDVSSNAVPRIKSGTLALSLVSTNGFSVGQPPVFNGVTLAPGTVLEANIDAAIARLSSPALTGTPTVPTASPGTSNTVVASTAFVAAAVAGLGAGSGDVVGPGSSTSNNVVAFDGATGKVVKDSGVQVTNLLTITGAIAAFEPLNASRYQSTNSHLTELSASGSTGSGAFVRATSPTISSPTLTGTTSIETNNVGTLVVTNFIGTVPEANVDAAIARDSEVAAAYEPLNAGKYQATNSVLSDLVSAGSTGTGATVRSNSPAFGGTPTTPTAAPGTSNTVVASTAFVAGAVAGLSAGPGGGGDVYTTSNNVFTGSNAFGVATANTPAAGDNSTNVATTQWAIREFNTSTRRGVVTRIYGNCIAQAAANAMLPFTGAAISSGSVAVDAPFSSAIGDRFGIVNLRTATGVATGTGYYWSTSLTEAYATNGLLFSTKFVPSITNGTLARLGWGDSINTANDTDACILALSNSVVVGLVINNGSQAMTPTSFVIPQGVLSEGKTWISNSITHFEVSTNNVVAWQASLTNAPPATTSRVFGAIIKMWNTAAAATNAAVCLKIDDFLLEYPQ